MQLCHSRAGWCLLLWTLLISIGSQSVIAADLRLATFEIDVSPALGSPLAYDPTAEVTESLSCRGIILMPENQKPIALCAIDWLGVANASQDQFRSAVASAIHTTPDRVLIHALHQHDAPRCDLSAAEVLGRVGKTQEHYDVAFIQDCFARAAEAARTCLADAQKVDSAQFSKAEVRDVASNRRLLGPDGKVHTTRYTACADPAIRALPVGVIDPWLRALTFYGESGPIAVMTFYATHPQSYYRTGGANPDFPGMARNARQKATGVFHLHFNGAGGNIGAGKYNDGAHENRQVLADKVAEAMHECWELAARAKGTAVTATLPEIAFESQPVQLPLGDHLQKDALERVLQDETTPPAVLLNTAKKIAFLERAAAGHRIDVQRLKIGGNEILFLPGELFVEYQLAAQAMKPAANVMLAAYGDYGPGYIGTKVAYPQGGYEVSERASNVSHEVEQVLIDAMRELLGLDASPVHASDFTDAVGPLPRR